MSIKLNVLIICSIFYGFSNSICFSGINENPFEDAGLVVKGKFSKNESGYAKEKVPGTLLRRGVELSGRWIIGDFIVQDTFKGQVFKHVKVRVFRPDNENYMPQYGFPFNQTLLLFLKKDEQTDSFSQVDESAGWLISFPSEEETTKVLGLESLRKEILSILEVPDRKKIVDGQAKLLQEGGLEAGVSVKLAESQYRSMIRQAIQAAPLLGVSDSDLIEKLRKAKTLLPGNELFDVLRAEIENGDLSVLDDVNKLASAGSLTAIQIASVPSYAARGIESIARKNPEELRKYFASPIPRVRVEVLNKLIELKINNIEPFIMGLDDPDLGVRYKAFMGIQEILPNANYELAFRDKFDKDPDRYVSGCRKWLLENKFLPIPKQ